MRTALNRPPPADGGYPADSDLHQMSDDGGPVGPDPARWADPMWADHRADGDAETARRGVGGDRLQPDPVGAWDEVLDRNAFSLADNGWAADPAPADQGDPVIPIYFNELAEVLKACTSLRPDVCAPADLRRLMADRLTHTNYSLAERVKAFNAVQMLALSAFVLQAQVLVGMATRGGR